MSSNKVSRIQNVHQNQTQKSIKSCTRVLELLLRTTSYMNSFHAQKVTNNIDNS